MAVKKESLQILELQKDIMQKQMDAIIPFKGLTITDIETRRTQYGERFSLSVDTTIDDDTNEAVVMPVILFVPDTKEFEHFHIELKDVRGLYEWLGKFLAIAESKGDYTEQDEEDFYAEKSASPEN